MDNQNQTPGAASSSSSTPSTAPPPSTTATSLSSQPPPQPPSPALSSPQPQLSRPPPNVSQPPPTVSSSTSSSISSSLPPPTPNPNPNPNQPLKPLATTTTTTTTTTTSSSAQSQAHTVRPQVVQNRPWQNQHFQQFSSSASPSFSTTTLSSSSGPPPPRVAIGVPAPSPSHFSTSFVQHHHHGGANSVNSQMRPGIGMAGPMSSVSGSQVRAAGGGSAIGIGNVHQHHPHQRPTPPQPSVPSPVRPPPTPSSPSPKIHSPAPQNMQGHGLMRPSSAGPASPAPNTSQSMQSTSQPWLSSASQGKPPLPSPSYRPQMNSISLQQRSHIPSQHHSLSTPPQQQQQHISPAQPHQSLASHQPSEQFGLPFPPIRGPRSITQQLALQGSANLKPASLPVVHPSPTPNTVPSTVQLGTQIRPYIPERPANVETDESNNRILSKRTIHELVTQIDPSEKLDPEVEDILADIADEFIESITTFGCSLAKHRKSDTLEAKDILLHLERNWNMTLPGFGGDEIKTYRKQLTNDIHKERLAVIKKSILATEMAGAKSSVGQAAGNAKSNLTRTTANAMISPNLKM